MKIIPTQLSDLALLEPKVFADSRGFFYESYNAHTFDKLLGKSVTFVQDNHSHSSKGVVRGLHFQRPPHEQGKLVRCTAGEIYDVAVDIRAHSPTLGQWQAFHLSAENQLQLWIPAGFAHGFLVLSETCELQYKTTDFYNPGLEVCIRWDDPTLAIEWPLSEEPIISDKDKLGLDFTQAIAILPHS